MWIKVVCRKSKIWKYNYIYFLRDFNLVFINSMHDIWQSSNLLVHRKYVCGFLRSLPFCFCLWQREVPWVCQVWGMCRPQLVRTSCSRPDDVHKYTLASSVISPCGSCPYLTHLKNRKPVREIYIQNTILFSNCLCIHAFWVSDLGRNSATQHHFYTNPRDWGCWTFKEYT